MYQTITRQELIECIVCSVNSCEGVSHFKERMIKRLQAQDNFSLQEIYYRFSKENNNETFMIPISSNLFMFKN